MFLKYNVWGFGWAIIILLLSIIPGKDLPPVLLFGNIPFDAVVHGFMYFILTVLFSVGFTKQYAIKKLRYHPARWAIVIALSYGIIIEVIQLSLVPDRNFELSDILSNFAGSVVGLIGFHLLYIKI